MADIKRVGVLGCGLMGSGIAQVAATAGYDTIVRDVSKEVLDRGRTGIEKSLANFVEKGKLPAEGRDATLKRLSFTTTVADLKSVDIVIEAITEDLALKNALFKELDALCGQGTIFASNTSSLTIAEMAGATKRADRFVGLHFFNPVPLMALVEVVRTVTTSAETFKRAFAFAASLGKEPIAAKDTSGFIVNLLLVPYLLDAIRAVERGVGSVPDIDKAMQLGCGYPMGPLTLLDFVGLDTTYKIAEIMFTEYREQRYAPPPLLKRMVLAGMNGRKSGKGFYDYSADPPKVLALGVFHAAVNDLPAALLFVTVLFDLGAWVTKRDSLKSAAVWTLWAGVIGGWVAVLAGLQAEDVIEHGEAIHELMETHETVALTTMGIFTVVLAWKLFRRSKLTGTEEAGLRVLSVAGLVAIIWTGVLGSKLMFEHAAGIPNATLQVEIENREAGHHHEAGEAEEQEHAAPADTAKAAGHTHAPGTPPHKH